MSNWLAKRRAEDAQKIADTYPVIVPGMFVQLETWFGDVWAEITSTYQSWEDPSMRSVDFIRYEKYGVSHKADSARFGDIRKIATREEVDFNYNILHMDNSHRSYGVLTEWPEGSHRRDMGGYELHPTKQKPV
jgi:hypothetical protein